MKTSSASNQLWTLDRDGFITSQLDTSMVIEFPEGGDASSGAAQLGVADIRTEYLNDNKEISKALLVGLERPSSVQQADWTDVRLLFFNFTLFYPALCPLLADSHERAGPVLEALSSEPLVRPEQLLAHGRAARLCPYELMHARIERADLVVADHSHVYPGMQRVVQAAGRVHRTPEDRGVIVLLGARFCEPPYCDAIPSHSYDYARDELVTEEPMTRLRQFWTHAREA